MKSTNIFANIFDVFRFIYLFFALVFKVENLLLKKGKKKNIKFIYNHTIQR